MGNDAIDYINRDIVNVKNELHTISKLVRDGNGQPSLIAQVSTLNSEMERLNSEFKTELRNLQDSVDSLRQSINEKNNLSWQFKTALILALITSFTSIFINYSENKTEEHVLLEAIGELNRKIDNQYQSNPMPMKKK